MGVAAPRDGLWQWHDMLAVAGPRAGRGSLAAPPPQAVRLPGRGGPDRLDAGGYGRGHSARPPGGPETGPSPTDRGKAGTQRPVLVDRQGIPLAIPLSGAKVPDGKMREAPLEAFAPSKRPCGRPRKRPAKLPADTAYEAAAKRQELRRWGITPRIARRGVESSERLGR